MEITGVRNKWFIVMGLLFCLVFWWVPAALADDAKVEKQEALQKVETKVEEEKGPEMPTWSVGADILSQYVWRGIALSRSSGVLQPSITGAYKGFSVNIWSNFDTNEQNPFGKIKNRGFGWNETDLTFSYSKEVITNLTLTGGVIYYIFTPNNASQNSFELYGAADYKLPWFNFGVSAFREIMFFPGYWLQWYIHRAIDIPYLVKGMNLDLFASWSAEFSYDKVAYPTTNNSYFQGLDAGYLAAALNIPLGKYFVLAPKIQYWYALGGQSTYALSQLSWDGKHNHILGGLNLTANF